MKLRNSILLICASASFCAAFSSVLYAAEIKDTVIKTDILAYPQIGVQGLNYRGLRAEIAIGQATLGKKTKTKGDSLCVVKGTTLKEVIKKKGKNVTRLPNEYYRISYRTPEAIMVVTTSTNEVVLAEKLNTEKNAVTSYAEGECKGWWPGMLEASYKKEQALFKSNLNTSIRKKHLKQAQIILERDLFFSYQKEKFKLFKVKGNEYGDLQKAYDIAKTAYQENTNRGYNSNSSENLEHAIRIWEKALLESDVKNKRSRINKKITIKLHQNIGMAAMFSLDYSKALLHLRKANDLTTFKSTSSSGMGSKDLLQRATQRNIGYMANRNIDQSPSNLLGYLENGRQYIGKINTASLNARELPRLQALLHKPEPKSRPRTTSNGSTGGKYAELVSHTSMQGYILHVIGGFQSKKWEVVPKELFELTQLNQLTLVKHQITTISPDIDKLVNLSHLSLASNKLTSLPPEIGKLKNLRKLDLSKNNLTTLPAEMADLTNLKKLNLKKNNFSPAELKRIKSLLPKCKIKS